MKQDNINSIRRLKPQDFDALIECVINAYPGFKITSSEEKERFRRRLLQLDQAPDITMYGLFRAGRLLGSMYLFDFTMNMLSVMIPAGGVGTVAVDLLHKKEHVARDMIVFFLRRYRERGAPLALLYPFRPDFYKQMGFGYGVKMNQYRVRPAALPKGPSKADVRYLDKSDQQAMLDCYTRVARATHGMIEKAAFELSRENSKNLIVGCETGGQLRGYVVFSFEYSDAFILNDIHVHEFIYQDRQALSELLTFLHTQADQVRHVIFDTQDEFFHHLLLDPRAPSQALIPSVYHESNTQGVGLMYRVLDTRRLFDLLKGRSFGGQTCTLKLTLQDSFLPENAGSLILRFENGAARLVEGGAHDVELSMDVAEFSSLVVGAVNLRSLYKYGLADVSIPSYVSVVDKIFDVEDKPICTTAF